MKKLFNCFVSLFLVVTMIFSFETNVFAADFFDNSTIGTQEEIEYAINTYNSLSSEAKEIFERAISNDPELLEFHHTYVDKDFVAISSSVEKAVTDPITILSAQLAALNLPSAVSYALNAMGAGMVAAIADGPLPIGDILLAAATVSATVVIATNWNSIATKWYNIVNAFKKAFADSAANVISAFQTILNDVETELVTSPCVSGSGQYVKINGEEYYCSTKADNLTSKQQQNQKYFPAILYNGSVYVDPLHPLVTKTAQIFMYANNPIIGIWATSNSYARGLCGGSMAIWHNAHSSSEGYFYHYHHPSYKSFHCWYL